MKKINIYTFTICFLTIGIFMGFNNLEYESFEKNLQYEIIGVRILDVDGQVHRLGIENKKTYPVSITFIDIGCVISQRMIPHLNELYKESESIGVKFYGVVSNPAVKWNEAANFKKEFDIKFPLLFDANGDLANRLKPSVVPESFVLDIYDNLVYYGRINDQFVDIGKFNKNIRNADLKNAISTVAKREKLLVSHQPAKGCIFEPWDKKQRTISFNKDIDPIIKANCVSCHKPNDIGPFPLITYNDVSRRGKMVSYVTKKRFMPIWKAKKGYGKFSNEHRLSEYQINLIQKWIKNGKEEGKPEDLIPYDNKVKSEWKLGKPDLILKMEPYDLPASGDDQYRVLVMKNAIPKGKIIKAIDFKPGDPAVVHHSTIFIDYTKKIRKYDAEDPKPGYDAFEKGGTMEFGGAITVSNWAPGIGPYSYPENVGFYVENDADLVFENHYHLSGKATTDQSYVGIYFAKQTPEKYITGSIMGTQKLQIPAGETAYRKYAWAYVPVDIELFDLTPHMHYIGKEVKVEVTFPDGKKKPLLHITDWDLRWQNVYTLRELMLIPKGSIISAEFVYDNSDDNHDNPYYPAKEMYWGWGSNDEMCEVYFSYIPKKHQDYGKMIGASFASFEHFYPSEKRIEVNEKNLQNIANAFIKTDIYNKEGQILLISIIESCLANELIEILNQKKKDYKYDSNFKINLMQLILSESYFSFNEQKMIKTAEKGATVFYNELSKEPNNWNASFSYGKLLLNSGTSKFIKQGVNQLKNLIESQEKGSKKDKYHKAYWELGKYYYGLGDDKKAEEVLNRGLKIFPNHPDLKQELASEGRIIKKKLN